MRQASRLGTLSLLSLIFFLSAVCGSLSAGEAPAVSRYALQAGESRTYAATLTTDWQTPGFAADDWIAFVAVPPHLPGRQSGVKLQTSPAGQIYFELSPERRKLVRIRSAVTDAAHASYQRFTATFEFTLTSRHLVERSEGGSYLPAPPLTAAEKACCLAKDASLDFDSHEFQTWLARHHLRRRPGEDDVDFARRAFRQIAESLRFVHEHPELERRTSHVCTLGQSDCSGLSNMFVGTLRNAGIPSRVLVGHWAKSRIPAQHGKPAVTMHHVVSEFYVPTVGWVPVDMYKGVTAKPDEKMAGFGKNDASFFTMHLNRYFVVDSIHFGHKTLKGLQGMKTYVHGHGKIQGDVWTDYWLVSAPVPSH